MDQRPVGAGLCDSCRHQRVVTNTRGSRFSLCELSRSDPAFPKYPRIPVLECRGHDPRGQTGYEVSTDRARLDVGLIHRFLAEDSYWARGVPRDVVERSIEHSICFGAYRGGRQVGFARAVTDRATFGWLADVFVVPEHRGRGVGKLLVEAVLTHPELRTLRRWLLGTLDAHGLYRRYGFEDTPEARFMMRETEAARRALPPSR